jgi:hypothetical protein
MVITFNWSKEDSTTFEVGDPAVSFSRYTGMARGPNSGVAQRHDLVDGSHKLITQAQFDGG